ncbi:MAG TPA: hypothetical protein VHB20_10885 [Verrucomicrobiae bacterium]|jgi:hypothetical protein|nr:hypothetical protein [Verrucomicrobiae bacterium]
MKKTFLQMLAVAAFGAALSLQAQWQTQSILIKPGWSAIYVHVDASYDTLNDLIGNDHSNPITEVWMWQPPAGTSQYITSPQNPATGASQWLVWEAAGTGLPSTLAKLVPNAAYLVHSTASGNYTWNIQGRPMAPTYAWTTTGENFLGFPTPSALAPKFDAFFAPAPSWPTDAEIYQYQGGALSTINPSQVFSSHTTPVTRGQAYWIRTGSFYNNYYGPFSVTLQDSSGVNFGDSSSQYSLHLKNATASAVTVKLKLLASETPPTFPPQTPIAGVPPLLVRGALIASNLTYTYTNLTTSSSVTWTLPPQGKNGSDMIVVIGLNRYALTNNPGALYAGILQLTDAAGLSEVDLPVSANVASYAGLWVGKASVSQVQAYLKSFQRDGDNTPIVDPNTGSYTVTGINTNLGPTASTFPLRLIVHNDGTHARLLQRVFYGSDLGSNTIVTTSESSLDPAQLGSARRISSIDLPWTPNNTPISLSGSLAPGGLLQGIINLDYGDQASNPFLHTYHPDHDNLDVNFQKQLPVGSESYTITRNISLNITPPNNDFTSLTQAGQTFTGAYAEAVTLTGLSGATRTYNVAGSFGLSRISSVAVLTP